MKTQKKLLTALIILLITFSCTKTESLELSPIIEQTTEAEEHFAKGTITIPAPVYPCASASFDPEFNETPFVLQYSLPTNVVMNPTIYLTFVANTNYSGGVPQSISWTVEDANGSTTFTQYDIEVPFIIKDNATYSYEVNYTNGTTVTGDFCLSIDWGIPPNIYATNTCNSNGNIEPITSVITGSIAYPNGTPTTGGTMGVVIMP